MKIMKAKKSYDFNVPNTNDPSEDIKKIIDNDQLAMDLKCDGTRAIIDVDAEGNLTIYGRGTVQKKLHSKERQQRIYNEQFPELAKMKFPKLALSRFDTEIIITNPDTNMEDYNLLQKRANRKDDIGLYSQKYPATVRVFDMMKFDGEDITGLTLKQRKSILHMHFPTDDRFKMLPIAMTPEGKRSLVMKALHTDAEGVMIKDLDSPYVNGSGNWFKAKRTHSEDVIVLGISPGAGKFKPYFGQLHCYQFDEHGDLQFICDVGGGFTFEEMAHIRDHFGKYYDKPISNTDMKDRYNEFQSNGKLIVIEIKHYGIIKKGRRHPVFSYIRNDKDADECVSRSSIEEDSDGSIGMDEFF